MIRLRVVLAGASLLLLAGCSSKDPVQVAPEPLARTWIGTFSNATQTGPFALDVVQTGTTLKGEVVYRSYQSECFFLRGSLNGNSLHLELDTSRSPYQFTFTIDGVVAPDSGLAGDIALPLSNFAASITCHRVPRRQVTTEATFDLPYSIKDLVYDGSRLWLSTTGIDYVRMTTSGAIVDTVVVTYQPNTHWTSSALTWDGTELWGTLPGSLLTPGGSIDYDEMLGFGAGGRTGDSLRIWHRSAGLAFDGTDFHSLGGTPLKLYRLTRAGALVDSVQVDVPDADFLALADGHLWTLGWFMKRLYELDASGHAMSVCDLPGQDMPSIQGGLTADGPHLWYADDRFGYTAVHRLTVQ